MPDFDAIVNLPGITVLGAQAGNPFIIHGTYDSPVNCPKCGAKKLRKKAEDWPLACKLYDALFLLDLLCTNSTTQRPTMMKDATALLAHYYQILS